MKRWISGSLLGMITLITPVLVPNTAYASDYTYTQKSITVNGSNIENPYAIVAGGTTYMPIWYIEQALNKVGVQNPWNGKTWSLSAPTGVKPDLTNVNPGKSASASISLNNVVIYNLNSIAAQDKAGGTVTTYMPIWYIMQILKRLSIPCTWDGNTWGITLNTSNNNSTSPASGSTGDSSTNSSGSNTALQTAGIIRGAYATGSATENWQSIDSSPDVSMTAAPYNPNSNEYVVAGKFTNGYHGTVGIMFVNDNSSESWLYSGTTNSDGSFQYTVVNPFSGHGYVLVMEADDSKGQTTLPYDTHGAGMEVNNGNPSLTKMQLAMLESWMVNYTMDPSITQLAEQIVAPIKANPPVPINPNDDKTSLVYQEALAISDYVSNHIYYNFPESNQNNIAFQSATYSLKIGNGVCQDESAVAAALMRSIGIPASTIAGNAGDPLPQTKPGDTGDHEWIEFWDGTRWVIDDPTWDQIYYSSQSNGISAPSGVDHDYFDPSPQDFAKDHVALEPAYW